VTDLELLDRVLAEDERLRADDADERRCLHPREREAFEDMRYRLRSGPAQPDDPVRVGAWRDRGALSEKQAAWVRGAAERLGLLTAGAANTFSSWSPERQAAERARVKTRLPFEGAPRPLKPPGRG
jgi:hypothetical protein